MSFKLTSRFRPTGDQPQAIDELVHGFESGVPFQTLLGVTGSGKTFTAANVIARLGKPTLVLSHNKTLAAQLYAEFKAFFPDNAVEYFVSYYDYYQPEAYIAASDTYIEKDMAINAEIEKLRLRATASLLSGREDVIVISSVSCLYGMADPKAFEEKILRLQEGQRYSQEQLKRDLVLNHYVNDRLTITPGYFRVKGDTIDIFPSIEGFDGVAYRVTFWDDEIERIASFDPQSGREYGPMTRLIVHPANLFVTTQEQVNSAVGQIDVDLGQRVQELEDEGRAFEAKRLYERTTYDLEMIRELGYCSGIENYSRYFDGRQPGERPFCLLDYFPNDFLLIIDESHVTVPQIHAMYGGDRSRKTSLVEYGFRLPAATTSPHASSISARRPPNTSSPRAKASSSSSSSAPRAFSIRPSRCAPHSIRSMTSSMRYRSPSSEASACSSPRSPSAWPRSSPSTSSSTVSHVATSIATSTR